MGFAMASNVRKKMPTSSTLYVYDVHQPSCERFASGYNEFGPIKITDSVRDAAAHSQVVISIVPTAQNVREVYLDESSGLVAAPADSERLILECSTIDSASTREVGESLKASKHGYYVDTPVSVRLFDALASTPVLIRRRRVASQQQKQELFPL